MHHRCTCKWDLQKCCFLPVERVKTVWILLDMSTGRCQWKEGHNLYPSGFTWDRILCIKHVWNTRKSVKLCYMTFWDRIIYSDYNSFWRQNLIREVFIGYLQRVLANRGRLLLRTPGPVPFGTRTCSNVETILSWTCHIYGPFAPVRARGVKSRMCTSVSPAWS